MRNKHCQPSHIYVLASLILKFEFCKPSFLRWWNPSSTVLPTSPCMCQGCTKRKCVSAAQKNTNFPAYFLCFETNHACAAPNIICFLFSSKSYVFCMLYENWDSSTSKLRKSLNDYHFSRQSLEPSLSSFAQNIELWINFFLLKSGLCNIFLNILSLNHLLIYI